MQWCLIMYITEGKFRARGNSELILFLIKIQNITEEFILEDKNFCVVDRDTGYAIYYFPVEIVVRR